MIHNTVLLYKALLAIGSVSLVALIFNVFYDRMRELTDDGEELGFDEAACEKSIRQKEGPYKAHNTWHTDMTSPISVEVKPEKEAAKKKSDWDEEDAEDAEERDNFNLWEGDEGI